MNLVYKNTIKEISEYMNTFFKKRVLITFALYVLGAVIAHLLADLGDHLILVARSND
jgi:short-subunit dehydrogenase